MESATDSFFRFFHSLFVSPLFLKAVRAVGVAIVFELLEFIINRRIDKALAPAFRLDNAEESGWRVRRRRALQVLPKRLTQFSLYAVAGLMILHIFGVETTGTALPVAAVLGLIGAVGLRGLMADVVRGYIILLQHWYAPGHGVTIGDVDGTVSDVTLTATLLRTDNGETLRIRNSLVDRVVDRGRPAVPEAQSMPTGPLQDDSPEA